MLKPHHLMKWGKSWHRIQAIQRLFNWGEREAELIAHNPFRKLKRPPLGQRRRTLDRGGLVKLLRLAAHDFRAYLLTLRESICRPQEARAVRWEEIHHDGPECDRLPALRSGRAFFVLHEFKARERGVDPNRPRIIPISVRLGRLLARLAQRQASVTGPVLLSADGVPWTKEAVRLRMKRLRRRAGMKADHRGEQVVSYTFRHSMATAAAAAGVRDRVLADLMGHTTTRTTARYQHLDAGHLSDALHQVHKRQRQKKAA
jgi:integrase